MRIMMKLACAITLLLGIQPCLAEGDLLGQYNVVWDSPSVDHTGQMPLGSGDIAAGVYAIENDAIYLLLSKNDAFTYNGDIFKTGRVKISISPNPFAEGRPFKQILDLKTGSIRIAADDVKIRVWADANKPIYHVQIESPRDVSVRADSDLWTRFDSCQFNRTDEPLDRPQQDVRLEQNGHILWYYAVGDRSVYPTEIKYYGVEHMADVYPDPYRFNTFGNLLESPDLALEDGVLRGAGKVFDIRIHALCAQEKDVEAWIQRLEDQAKQPLNAAVDWSSHCDWWDDFWSRSWITVSDNTVPTQDRNHLDHEGYTRWRSARDQGALVAQSYNVFRYLMACQSRGRIQAKFNGGLFTQPLRYQEPPRLHHQKIAKDLYLGHEDARLWGRRFTFQNQRLLYWPLLMSGDADLMKPFFDYYWQLLPVRKAITRAWFEHEGAYFRENIEPTGGERDCGPGKDKTDRTEEKPLKTPPGGNSGSDYYHSYYFTSGLETVAMMIEHAKYSGDETFRDEVLVPFAREILTFYDKHYERDAAGKLRLDPSMVLETWWFAINPAPDISGLLHNLDELLALGVGTEQDQHTWKRLRSEIPDVHLHEIDGRLAIAPAQEYGEKHNSENGELYPVFPFQRFGLGLGSEDIVKWTMEHRTIKDAFKCKCWTQDQIHWAYAGSAFEAKEGLVTRFRHAAPQCRFPVYGSEGPDSCPDFDHFGAGSVALQRMLVQEAAGKILLLPAWPKEWDTDFKLHLAGNTVISGTVTDGQLKKWHVEPASRARDVVLYDPQ